MPFVLDASTTVAWAFEDESHPHAKAALARARSDQLLVPWIWWYEIRNVLVVNERRGRGSTEQTEQFLQELSAFSIEIVAPSDEEAELDLARNRRLTFYDAAYLALARRRRTPLATLDSFLCSAALAEGVPVIGIDA